MNNQSATLPSNPSYQRACDIIDHWQASRWQQTIESICSDNQITLKDWFPLNEGSNALFNLNREYIIKIVPPNWKNQGIAENESAKLLTNKLSLQCPKIIATGEINNWYYGALRKMRQPAQPRQF